jgi:ATP-binding cassette subfamily C protein CydC
MALGILLSLITVLANVGLMAMSGWFISAMALAGAAGVSMNYFTPAGWIRAAAMSRTAGRYTERLVTHEATFRLLAQLRVWFYERIEPLAPAVLEHYHSGDVLSRIRADIDTLNNVYLRLFVPVVVAVVASIILVTTLAFYQPVLAVLEAILLLIAGVLMPWSTQRLSQQAGQQTMQLTADLRAQLISDIQGMGELLVYGADTAHAQQVHNLSWQLIQQQRVLNRLNALAQAALSLCANLAMWFALLLVIPLVVSAQLATAELSMLVLLVLASFEVIAPLPLAMQSLGETLAAARRIFALATQALAIQEPLQPLAVPQRFDLQFKQVDLYYPQQAQPALQQVSFNLPAGTSMAIVGASGSGKSSIASLLLRFREPSAGQILINGQAIQAYNSSALRKQIAAASQHTHLFNTSIRENLLLANPEATQAELEAACQATLIHDFIQVQPDGYNTWVGETGVKLSGGQVRRIGLARVLLKPAALLILDEPTEGLDPLTSVKVLDNILHLAQQRQQSIVLITHQLQDCRLVQQTLSLGADNP